MKKILILLLGMTVLLSWFFAPVMAANRPPLKGGTLPSIKLPIPKNRDEKNYLGLSGQGFFRIPQIKAKVVIIEIFSLYCPQCQAFAPEVNVLYRMIEQVPEFKENIKLIGIGAGNSDLESETFKKTYDVPFPVFSDQDFAIHKLLGEVRTPYFIAIKINEDRSHRVIYSELRAFGEAEVFLQRILRESGLKEKN